MVFICHISSLTLLKDLINVIDSDMIITFKQLFSAVVQLLRAGLF